MSNKGFTYTLTLDAEIKDIIAKTNQVKKSMEAMMAAGKAPGAEKTFANIEKAISKLQEKAAQPITSVAGFNAIQKESQAVQLQLNKLGETIKELASMSVADKMELLPPDLQAKINTGAKAIDTFEKKCAEAKKKTEELTEAEKALATAKTKLRQATIAQTTKSGEVKQQQEVVEARKADVKAIEAKIAALKKFQATTAAYEEAGADKRKSMGDTSYRKDKAAAQATGMDISAGKIDDSVAELTKQLQDANAELTKQEKTLSAYEASLAKADTKVNATQGTVNGLTNNLDKLNKEFEDQSAKDTQDAFTALRNAAKDLGIDLKNIPVDYTEENFEQLKETIGQFVNGILSQVDDQARAAADGFDTLNTSVQSCGEKVTEAGVEVEDLKKKMDSFDSITARIKDFVGLAGGINIARKAMQSAYNTVKELDAVMAEMAVVTDLEVGDYWNQLPEHAERAQQLGVAMTEVYKAETLYYQQGLKSAEVTEMATQTLQMARIAGLSAEDATNKMTAALRGFNMELNETSAQRIADVYSELAAITASDVDEISSAMTKTASIAASAGMEFETTAAFLSQIIETTRESAETAGTAMKTVIARFQELKKDPAEIGEVDGEIVDANKIETALRSVGVALRDSSGQFRELDDVFLELSSKWDGLDTNTQRYIATIAAGSRQQSRFIAMMSDYSRTQDLVTAANTSAGASAEQYGKLIDTLDTKLANLKTAWESFTMSIMDSDLIKMGVDILTAFVNAINALTEAFGPLDGAAKIGAIIAALYLGDKAIKVFRSSLEQTNSVFTALGATGRAALDSINQKYKTLQKLFTSKLNVKVGSEELVRATQATNAYKQSTIQLKAIEQQRIEVAKAGNLSTAQAAMYSQQAAEATAIQSAAEKELMATMGLSATQMEAVQALQALDVATGDALILTKAGISAATLTEISAINGKTAAENASTLAQNLSNASGIRAISAKMGLTIANWAQTASENAKTGSVWANVTATIAQTMANWGLQASMFPILIVTLLLVAAIGALVLIVWLIVEAFKAWEANSPENKLKEAEKASKSAAEAAEQAAEAYNNLADALKNVTDRYEAIEKITRGTEEWQQAVKAVNEEVLNLIERYPELSKYVQPVEGVLTLDLNNKEVQKILDKYEKMATASSNAALTSKVVEGQARVNKTVSEIQQNNTYYYMYDAGGEYDQESGEYYPNYQTIEFDLSQQTIEDLALAVVNGEFYDKNGNGNYKEELEDWLNDRNQIYADIFAGYLSNDIEDLRRFGEELQIVTEQERVYHEQMAQNAISLMDLSKFTDEQISQIRTAGTDNFTDSYFNQRKAEYEKAVEDKSVDISDYKKEVVTTMYSANATLNGNTITYYDEQGDPQTEELSDEDFKNRWAMIKATEDMANAFELVPGRIGKMIAWFDKYSEGLGQAYKQLATDKGKVTKKEADKLGSIDNQEIKEYLIQMYDSLSKEEQASYGSYAKFEEEYFSPIKELNTIFADGEAKVAKYTGGIVTLNENLTSDTVSSYTNLLGKISTSTGQNVEAINELNDIINTMGNSLPTEDFNVFIRELNAIDISNTEDWEDLKETLDSLHLSSITSSNSFKLLESKMQEVADAIEKIDLQKFGETFRNLQKIASDIYSGELERVVDDDVYNELIASNKELAKDFILTNDGYMYIGSTMNDLAGAILENTEVQRQANLNRIAEAKTVQNIATQLGSMRFLDETGKATGKIMSLDNTATFGLAEQRNYIASIVQSMTASGLNVSDTLQIEGLTNDTNIASLNAAADNDIQKMFDQLVTFLKTDWEVEKQKQRDLAQSAMFNYDKTQNATAISGISSYARENGTMAANSTYDKANGLADAMVTRGEVMLAQAIQAGVEGEAIEQYRANLQALEDVINSEGSEVDKLKAIENIDFGSATLELLAAAEAAEKISEEVETWETEYGYLDQLTRQVSQAQREKEKAERAYNRLLEDETLSQEEILSLTKQQAEALNKEANLNIQKWAESASALASMTDKSGVNAEFAKFVNYNAETGEITIDYDAANQAFGNDPERGDLFEEYVANLYDLQAATEEAQDSLDEIEDEMKELQERGKDDYSDLWTKVKEALVKNQQASIDKLSEVNESIQEAQSALVDQMQKQIEEQRQARENEKTEQDISDKETRLAYLMMNTSGANDVEIANLQKEIADEKENYTNNLIDQNLQKLQDANEEAAKQRQEQIDIAQAQLDVYANSQQAWNDAQLVLNHALSNEGAFGAGLADLGINMEMLLGPDGTMAHSLTDLLASENSLNDIERQAYDQSVLSQMENATLYAAMNGHIVDNGTQNTLNLADLGVGITTEFSLWRTKAGELNTATNTSINAARDKIAQDIISTKGALDEKGAINTSLSGLATKKEEETFVNSIKSGTDATKSWINTIGDGSKNGLFKDYKDDLDAIATKANQEKTIEQARNYQNLLTDNYKLSPQEFQALQASGAIDSNKTYKDYESAYNNTANRKKEQSQGSTPTVNVIGGGTSSNIQSEQELKKAYPVTNHSGWYTGWGWDQMNFGDTYNKNENESGKAYIGGGEYMLKAQRLSDGPSKDHKRAANIAAKAAGVKQGRMFIYDDDLFAYDQNSEYAISFVNDNDKSKALGVMKYETGGLADFTGPAWLDGTKSRPEMVLNARDTENFIQLKDILSEILTGAASIKHNEQSNSGDNYFDIQISVDNIEDDYSVDQMAERIKEIIYEDATYRNVTAINNLR